jgi:hypothetical protein
MKGIAGSVWYFSNMDGKCIRVTSTFSKRLISDGSDRFSVCRADVVELHFSDPVTERLDGSHVSADIVHPGYAEIRFQYD